MLKQVIFIGVAIASMVHSSNAQQAPDSIYVQAKIWSRDANRQIQYSDWKSFGSITVNALKNFTSSNQNRFDVYGGNKAIKLPATGFFSTIKKDNRWWVSDPKGHAFINMAVNGVRLGKSPNNEAAFAEKFATNDTWIAAAKKILDENGFNSTGSWSDIETIKAFNKTNSRPIVYTTQLSMLGTFSQQQKKLAGGKEYPTLANIFKPAFKAYCISRAIQLIAADAKDANIFGHFSDNELPFQNDLIQEFLALNDTTDNAYLAAVKWLAENKTGTSKNTKEQKEMFSGFVASFYYQTVSESIKGVDPNHLYLGSRLHSSAKSNPYILAAAEKYLDIISINYYGNWAVSDKHREQWEKLNKPFIITEFYTKGEDSKMGNITGAGWLVKTQADRGIHYQNFCLSLLQIKNCVGWHWFRYQDNDPDDTTADPSNNDANKGIVTTRYETYPALLIKMKQLNINAYDLINYFSKTK